MDSLRGWIRAFAGVTAILAKCGIRKTDSTVATAIRTIVVLVFAWIMVFLVGSQAQLRSLDGGTLLFLVLSGLADRGLLALLFPGAADRRHQQGGAHRQIQHRAHHLLAFFLLGEPSACLRGSG